MAEDAKATSKPSIVKDEAGDAVLDFANYDDAVAQAAALGKGAWVESIGTAHHVHTDTE